MTRAKSVTVVATHGVLSGPAVDRLKNCGASEIVLTDTVPIPEEKRWDGLTVLSIAPLLASAIRAVFEDGSVAELFDTYPEHHGRASCSHELRFDEVARYGIIKTWRVHRHSPMV